VFDLNNQLLPHTYTQYTVSFIAANANTALSFQFREDPAFFFLDDIVLLHGTSGPNLVVNGGFENGTFIDPVAGTPQPLGWTYLNLFNAGASGRVATNLPHSGTSNYYDGAVGAYDGITQGIATTVGDLYTLSFWLTDNSSQLLGSQVNGPNGSGIDLLVYAGLLPTIVPRPVPEPSALALLALGIAGVLVARRRQQK